MTMKVYVRKTSDAFGTGTVREYADLDECIETLLSFENFGGWYPELIVSRPDDITLKVCPEKCEYEVEIYDSWRE